MGRLLRVGAGPAYGAHGLVEAQAEVAASYRSLQDQGLLKLHQLWFLMHRDAAGEEARVQAAITTAGTALEGQVAELRRLGNTSLGHIRPSATSNVHLAREPSPRLVPHILAAIREIDARVK